MKGGKVLKTFIWLHLILVGVQANGLIAADNYQAELNVTTSLEDYVAQLQRQYAYVISNDEAILTEFRAGYERQLDTVDAHRVFIETELRTVDTKLYSLQFLNELNKHCVQKYRGLLYAVATVTTNFNSCITSARSYLNSILSSCQSNINSLNSYLNSFKTSVTNCQRQNSASYDNQTTCVVNVNNDISNKFQTMQRSFLTNLDTARCSADTRLRQTVDCTFKTVNASINSIGSASSLIDGCIADLESCGNCQHGNGTHNNETSIILSEPQCANVVNVMTGAELYRNATIRNPFIGLNSTLDCILVNFLRPN